MSSDEGQELRAWFERYAQEVAGGELAALVERFALPLSIVTGHRTAVFLQRQALEQGLTALFAHYRRSGLRSIGTELLAYERLGFGLQSARVRWTLRDVVERPLWKPFDVHYVLRSVEGALKLCNIVNPSGL